LKKDLHLQLCLLCFFEKNKQNQICLLPWCKAFCFECNLFFIYVDYTTFRRVFFNFLVHMILIGIHKELLESSHAYWKTGAQQHVHGCIGHGRPIS
jgi:hypothetical protein